MQRAATSFRPRLQWFAVGVVLAQLVAPAAPAAPLVIDADSQYRYAQSRLDAEAFDEAVAEFNRFIHFFPSDARVPQARFQTGMALHRAGRYSEAALVFKRFTQAYEGLPLENEAFFMLSRSHADQGMLEQAMLDMHNLLTVAEDTDVIDRAHHELGWLLVEKGQWRRADDHFSRITPANRDRFQIVALRRDLAESQAIPAKNPTTAGVLSIVPGGGQLYCGRHQDALTAFIVNAGLIWAAWEAFDNDLPALGAVITFVEFGFYAGNIYGAVGSAHKYNRDQVEAFKNNLNRHRRPALSLAPTPRGAALCLNVPF